MQGSGDPQRCTIDPDGRGPVTATVGLGQALLQMLGVTILAGVGGAAALGWVIVGLSRTVEARARRDRVASVVYAGSCVAAGVAGVAVVVVGPLVLLR
jgi:hypothetical protein